MFRRSKCFETMRSSLISHPSLLDSHRFFKATCHAFSRKILIRSHDQQHVATHIEIKNLERNDSDALVKKVYLLIKQYPESHITFMSPTLLLDFEKPNAKSGRGYISPGHIHSSCINWQGEINENGDASFSSSGKSITQMLTPAYDSRLKGYQPTEISSCEGRFTSTYLELKKWAKLSQKYPGYPLFLFIKPFSTKDEYKRYLIEVAYIKNKNMSTPYTLMSYYENGSDEIMLANNCVSFNRELNENHFDIAINLGDNPTTQTAYFELIKKLYPQQKNMSEMMKVDSNLLGVHYEKDSRERCSFVI